MTCAPRMRFATSMVLIAASTLLRNEDVRADVRFVDGFGIGFADGDCYRRSDGAPFSLERGVTIRFNETSGGGGTSGGLVDGDVTIATISLTFSATITPGGPGVHQLDMSVNGDARFLEVASYAGTIACGVLMDSHPTIRITDPTGEGVYFTARATHDCGSVTSLQRRSDGVWFASGSVLPPGEYYVPMCLLAMYASDKHPVDALAGTFHAEFGPAPLCACDFNGDRLLNSVDFFEYVTAFFQGDPAADFDRVGGVNSQDFFDFLRCFFTECL